MVINIHGSVWQRRLQYTLFEDGNDGVHYMCLGLAVLVYIAVTLSSSYILDRPCIYAVAWEWRGKQVVDN